jgi:signal transduction histidine kinase
VVAIRDLTQRKRWERLLFREAGFVKLLQAVAVASNEAPDPRSALGIAVEQVCALTGWPVGHAALVRPGGDGGLLSGGVWHLADEAAWAGFRQRLEAQPGEDGPHLAARVRETRDVAWIHLPERTANPVATAVAVPVLVGTRVEALLEFFSPGVVEKDEALLEVLRHVGTQLGRVIERERAAAESRSVVDRLERSNRELEEFASVVSHDLQEPLRKIEMFATRLEATTLQNLEQGSAEIVSRMLGSARRMRLLIGDLLALSRVTTRGQPFVAVDLAAVVHEAVSDLEVRLEET